MNIFVYAHWDVDHLRLTRFESVPVNDEPRHCKISNKFDLAPAQAMAQHSVFSKGATRLGLSSIDSELNKLDLGFTFTPRPQQHRIELRHLGEFEGDQVYAVVGKDCFAEYNDRGYRSRAIYMLDTIAESLDDYLDAELFKAIRPALEQLEKEHV